MLRLESMGYLSNVFAPKTRCEIKSAVAAGPSNVIVNLCHFLASPVTTPACRGAQPEAMAQTDAANTTCREPIANLIIVRTVQGRFGLSASLIESRRWHAGQVNARTVYCLPPT